MRLFVALSAILSVLLFCGFLPAAEAEKPEAQAPCAGCVVAPGVSVYWYRPWVTTRVYVPPPVVVAPPVVVEPPVVVSPLPPARPEVSRDVYKRKWGALGLRGYRERHVEIR